jgi:hypothetical protein
MIFSMSCSDYINLSDAYALPFQDRKMLYDLVKEVKENLKKDM